MLPDASQSEYRFRKAALSRRRARKPILPNDSKYYADCDRKAALSGRRARKPILPNDSSADRDRKAALSRRRARKPILSNDSEPVPLFRTLFATCSLPGPPPAASYCPKAASGRPTNAAADDPGGRTDRTGRKGGECSALADGLQNPVDRIVEGQHGNARGLELRRHGRADESWTNRGHVDAPAAQLAAQRVHEGVHAGLAAAVAQLAKGRRDTKPGCLPPPDGHGGAGSCRASPRRYCWRRQSSYLHDRLEFGGIQVRAWVWTPIPAEAINMSTGPSLPANSAIAWLRARRLVMLQTAQAQSGALLGRAIKSSAERSRAATWAPAARRRAQGRG